MPRIFVRPTWIGIGFTALFSFSLTFPVFATPPTISPPAIDLNGPDQPQSATTEAPSGGIMDGLARSSYLLGDMGGLRPLLSKYGVTLNITETSELLGNVTGGAHQGFIYDGLTQMTLQLDTKRAFNWDGGTFNVSGLQIHGSNLSAENLYSLQTASGIEADRATRLWELWYQQELIKDKLDVKLGQQSLDQEFMGSQNAGLFVNTMFGWPMVPSADLPGGGPAYPLSALGVRVRGRPTDSITILAGVFNGSPARSNDGDPQQKNPSGISFPLNGGALMIAEIQYAYPGLGAMVSPDKPEPLSGTYKLGAWFDTEHFADQSTDNTGLSLANTTMSNGVPQMHYGNYSIYAVMDQMIWRSEDDADKTLNFFARPMGTTLEDRNLIDFSLNLGFTLHDPLPQRDDDTFGVGMGFTKVGNHVSDLDRSTRFYTGSYYPVRSTETYLEMTYQYEVTPWCQIQPDLQYVFNPGAGEPNPYSATGQRIHDELVLGVRLIISF